MKNHQKKNLNMKRKNIEIESAPKCPLTPYPPKGGLLNSMIFRCSPPIGGLGVKQRKIIEFYTFRSVLKIAIILLIALFSFAGKTSAQSYAAWYNKAQERIDTLRKGDFGIQIVDKNGQPFTGDVSVRMKKHEYPFGIAFDFYEGSANMGNSYSTTSTIQAKTDKEIYKTERWSKVLAYAIPVEKGKEYKVTLKFAEIYASAANARLFDVTVNGQLFLDNYDVFAAAGGKNIAVDTSVTIMVNDTYISIELNASKDNAAIKGIVIDEIGGANIIRINCGGLALTTADGNYYTPETGYFDPEVNTVASKEQWMQAAMYKYFNYGVTGNSFKWSGIQPQHTAPNYTNFENAVRWTQKVGWDLRAHTLLWGGDDDHSMPGWVRRLPTPQAITDTCKMRVIREVTRYKGIIKEYDVINEPLTNHADSLRNNVGDSILWNCFKWARSADPDAELFINDYNVEYNWGQAKEYRDLIKKIKAMGGPVTGVGMQAHFWDCCRPNVDELVKNVNIVAEAGLPIRFTEYDWGTNLTQKQQVDDFVKVLTVAFSHPSITGMISWGLSDDGAWRENTGFFDAKHKPKLAADTLLYYTQKKWATNFDSEISGENPLEFNAYYGDYEIEVAFGDTVKVFTIPCLKSNKDSVFVLNENDARLKGPELVSTKLMGLNSVKLEFDKPIQSSSLRRSNFKFFSNSTVGLNAVQTDPDNPNAIILTLSKNVTKGDYISVSYFPGNLLADDGSRADAFGPAAISNPEITVGISEINERALNVYPNPATSVLNIDYDKAPYKVLLFNSLGVLVQSEVAQNPLFKMNVGQLTKGLYLIRIQDDENNTVTKKVIIE
jgi:GH35 family endo-1,4-beta-xylanase